MTGSTQENTDVLVIGAGGGGLMAALTARSRGANVLVVDTAERVGGTYAYSSGLVWSPANPLAARDGIADGVDAARRHILDNSGGKAVPALVDAYLDAGPRAFDLMAEHDVLFDWIPGYPDYYAEFDGGLMEGRYLSSPVFTPQEDLPPEWSDRLQYSPYYTDIPVSWREIQQWGGYSRIDNWDWDIVEDRKQRGSIGWGGATVGYLLRACLRLGVRIELGMSVVTLTRTDGRVTGAEIHGDGRSLQVSATSGVILAAGGYDHSAEMQGFFDAHPMAKPLTNPVVDGGGIRLALDLGAALANTGGQLMCPVYMLPSEEGTERAWNIAGREMSFPGTIIVNSAGERFTDDSFYRSVVYSMSAFDRKSLTYPNLPAYLVFDEEWKQRYRLGYVEPGSVPDWLPTGATPEELAGAIGVSAEGLSRTISEFNVPATEGEDPRFGRGSKPWVRNHGDQRVEPNPCIRPLTGQLYAIELKLGTMGTLSGLLVDEAARVLDYGREPIPGLFACGNSMASLVEGYWYNSGTSNGRGLFFGMIAAETVTT